MTETIIQTGIRHVDEVRNINRDLTEKALHMRCLGYLAQVKARLLTETIFEIDQSKKNLLSINKKLTHQRATIATQKKQLERKNKQLTEARKLADSSNLAKSTFLANMSHEIRTPMNAIIGLTHLLQRTDPTADQATQLAKIDVSAKHLLSIINDILDISKIEAGKLTLEYTDFHMDSIFDHIQSLLKDQAHAKGLNIGVELGELQHWFKGDVTRLRQALINYVGNAIKFTEQGTIWLRAIKLDENDDGILIRFEVQDTGIGIKPDKIPRLFEPFKQADASTSRTYGGTGLGLTITRRLAQLMGGVAGVESEVGRGSTFWFTVRLDRGHGVLPANSPREVVDAETQLRAHYTGSRVLLAEDNAINREVAVALLSGAGLAVDTAINGKQAVEMVQQGGYDLVLMDLQMPEMEGLAATNLIRSMPDYAGLPILAMTANVFEEDRQACLDVGMNDFVSKPFNLQNLFASIIKWLPEN